VTGKEPNLHHTFAYVVNHHHLRKIHGAEPHALYQEANELKRDNLELRRKLREGDLQQKTSNLELMEQNMKLRDENYEMKKVDVDACDLHLALSTLHPKRSTWLIGGIPGAKCMAPGSCSL
jgi:ATP-dependent protease HslVU (ClpYQ) ATPase subunit